MTALSPVRTRCPVDLVRAVRAGWQRTAELVADKLRQHLPAADILTAAERAGDPAAYRCHLLHVEPDG